jgi:hypothetical protein
MASIAHIGASKRCRKSQNLHPSSGAAGEKAPSSGAKAIYFAGLISELKAPKAPA